MEERKKEEKIGKDAERGLMTKGGGNVPVCRLHPF